MNFTFSDHEKNLFQNMESALAQEKHLFVKGAFQAENDIAQALITFKQKLSSLGYFSSFNHSSSLEPVATLEMMRIFARQHPALFLGVEYGFRIVTEINRMLNESCLQSSQVDDSLVCAIAFCEDFVETDTKQSSINVQSVDDYFLLSGEKNVVINAGVAKYIAVYGHIDGKDTLFFISASDDSLDLVPIENKRFFPELAIANIVLRNCQVPQNMVLYPQQLNALISKVQYLENFACIACALGMIDKCIEITTGFAKTHQSGNKPLIAHQAVAFSLAETVTLKQTAELLAYRAAWMCATDDSEKIVMNQCAKVFCSEAAETIASQCINILGGQVFMDNHLVEQMLFNAKFLQLIGTSTHLARIAIADVALK